MEKRIFTAKTPDDLDRCYPLLKELRTQLSYDNFLSIYQDAHRADGYEIVVIEDEGKVKALMGYRFLSDYVRGKHLYIDDLVTGSEFRSNGYGAELLKYAESVAHESGCKSLRLCTGLENEGGIRFYDRNGWMKRSYAYTKKLGN